MHLQADCRRCTTNSAVTVTVRCVSGLGKLITHKSRFQEEFPELAAGADDKTQKKEDENKELQYGPGPSLRPQSELSSLVVNLPFWLLSTAFFESLFLPFRFGRTDSNSFVSGKDRPFFITTTVGVWCNHSFTVTVHCLLLISSMYYKPVHRSYIKSDFSFFHLPPGCLWPGSSFSTIQFIIHTFYPVILRVCKPAYSEPVLEPGNEDGCDRDGICVKLPSGA